MNTNIKEKTEETITQRLPSKVQSLICTINILINHFFYMTCLDYEMIFTVTSI